MSDILADRFDDLDYPGRRKPVNREKTTTKKKAGPDVPSWDDRPVRYMVNGEVREFYMISHLAAALGYSVQSIRAWEDKGLLPRSPFRSPRTVRPVAGGRSNKGKRLWTREQVEGIVRLARRHRVILNKRPPTPAFARDVKVLFERLTPTE
jgi:hypothetical protein